ncbi:MAG: hypothetical protein ABUT20_04900 [Bacteroidota bacterium]
MINRNSYTPVAFKILLLFFLLLQFSFLSAQVEHSVSDTVEIDTTTGAAAPPGDSSIDYKNEEKYFQDKSQYSEIIDSFHLRQLPDADLKKMQSDPDYWYANADLKKKIIKKEKKESNLSFLNTNWFQTLLWIIIIGGFAGFVIWYLAGNNVGLFRKKIKKIDEELGDDYEMENIFDINYQKEIDKATQKGNYRLAVRLMFLRLLKNLSEKNIIGYKQGKTNFDYLVELQSTRYYKDFFRLTRNYEYCWYGHFEIDEQAYFLILNDFKKIDKQLI